MSKAALVPVGDRDIPDAFVGKLAPNFFCRAWNAKRAKYCRARAGAGTSHAGAGRCRHHDGGGEDKLTHGQDRRYGGLQAPRIRELIAAFAEDPQPFDVRPELAAARALFVDWLERYETFVAALTAWYESWEGQYLPLNEQDARALSHVLDEYDALITEAEPTFKQRDDLERARDAVKFLAMPRASKPRQILDPADAMRHVDTISKVIYRAEQIRQHGSISIQRVQLFMLGIDRVLEVEVSDLAQRQRIRRGIGAIKV